MALGVGGCYLHCAHGIQLSHVSGVPTVSGGLTGAIWRDPVKLGRARKVLSRLRDNSHTKFVKVDIKFYFTCDE